MGSSQKPRKLPKPDYTNMNYTKKQEIHRLNELIDRALVEPSDGLIQELLHRSSQHKLNSLVERVRRRVTILSRHYPKQNKHFVEARDKMIYAIYGSDVPQGWYCGWGDGASFRMGKNKLSGVGIIIMDPQGNVVVKKSKPVNTADSFQTEIAALVHALEVGVELGAPNIRIYTDCKALVLLWLRHRHDRRLARIRPLAGKFWHMEIRAIPRLHNQPAHALARYGALQA